MAPVASRIVPGHGVTSEPKILVSGSTAQRGENYCQWLVRLHGSTIPACSDHDNFFAVNAETITASSCFVPTSAVKHDILQDEDIRNLLAELFLPHPQGSLSRQGLAEDISKHCRVVFCILLCIGEPQQIELFLKDEAVHDSQLPLRQIDPNWVWLTEDKWAEFSRIQWHFVAYTAHARIRTLDNRFIFPYLDCQRLGSGASSIVLGVRLHAEYDELCSLPDEENHDMSSAASVEAVAGIKQPPEAKIYALKIYKEGRFAPSFDAETKAFENIKGNGRANWPEGLIQYYGAYSMPSTGLRCLWLEYASGGTLEDMFKNVPPPTRPEDVRSFWTRLFKLIKGLAALHNLGMKSTEPTGEIPPNMHFAHFDIHLKNIVLVADPTSVDHEHMSVKYKYKLADLGSSSNAESSEEDEDEDEGPAFVDTKAGREYCKTTSESLKVLTDITQAAPEVSEQVDFEKRLTKHVLARADIFALGAVLLVAVVWTVLGPDGVHDFATARRKDCKARKRAARFHTDRGSSSTLLSIVSEVLSGDYLMPFLRQNDTSTLIVLELLVRKMLEIDPRKRSAAIMAMGDSDYVLEKLAKAATLTSRPHLKISGPRLEQARYQQSHLPASASRIELPKEFDYAQSFEEMSVSSPTFTLPDRQDISNPPSKHLHQDRRPRKSQSVRKRPTTQERVTVDAILEYRSLCKQQHRLFGLRRKPQLPQAYRLNSVKKKDIIFLVDDSATMHSEHIGSAARLVAAIAYVMKDRDADGIELYYSTSPAYLKTRSSQGLEDHIVQHDCKKQTHMVHRLRDIIATCLTRVTEKPSKQPGVCIFVLTDGRWADEEAVEELIIETTKTLSAHSKNRSSLCITFVSFGEYEAGIRCMAALDDLTQHNKAALDIVDHESYHRNDFYKILLGALDPETDRLNHLSRSSTSSG